MIPIKANDLCTVRFPLAVRTLRFADVRSEVLDLVALCNDYV